MRALIFGLVVIINFIIQASLFSYIEIFQVHPNTALLIVVAYAMLRGDVEGAIIGFTTGLMIDIVFGGLLGFYALIYAVAGFLCGKPFKDFIRENYLLPIVLTIASALVVESLHFGAFYALQGNTDFMRQLQERIIPATIYTNLFTLPVYFLVYRLNAKLEKHGY